MERIAVVVCRAVDGRLPGGGGRGRRGGGDLAGGDARMSVADTLPPPLAEAARRAEELECVNCELCGAGDTRLLFHARDTLLGRADGKRREDMLRPMMSFSTAST